MKTEEEIIKLDDGKQYVCRNWVYHETDCWNEIDNPNRCYCWNLHPAATKGEDNSKMQPIVRKYKFVKKLLPEGIKVGFTKEQLNFLIRFFYE